MSEIANMRMNWMRGDIDYFLIIFASISRCLSRIYCFRVSFLKNQKYANTPTTTASMILPKLSRMSSYRSMKNMPSRFTLVAQNIEPTILYIQNCRSPIRLAPAMNGTNDLVKLWNLPRTIYQNPFFSI